MTNLFIPCGLPRSARFLQRNSICSARVFSQHLYTFSLGAGLMTSSRTDRQVSSPTPVRAGVGLIIPRSSESMEPPQLSES